MFRDCSEAMDFKELVNELYESTALKSAFRIDSQVGYLISKQAKATAKRDKEWDKIVFEFNMKHPDTPLEFMSLESSIGSGRTGLRGMYVIGSVDQIWRHIKTNKLKGVYYRHLPETPAVIAIDLDPVYPMLAGQTTEDLREQTIENDIEPLINLVGQGVINFLVDGSPLHDFDDREHRVCVDIGVRPVDEAKQDELNKECKDKNKHIKYYKCSSHLTFPVLLKSWNKQRGVDKPSVCEFMHVLETKVLKEQIDDFLLKTRSTAADGTVTETTVTTKVRWDKIFDIHRKLRAFLQMKGGKSNTILKPGYWDFEEEKWVEEKGPYSHVDFERRNPFGQQWASQLPFFEYNIPAKYDPAQQQVPNNNRQQQQQQQQQNQQPPDGQFPLVSSIVTHHMQYFLNYRKKMARVHNLAHLVPDAFTPNIKSRTGQYVTYDAPDDRFCEHDSNHQHLQNPDGKITYTADLANLVVRQNCWVCGMNAGRGKWYPLCDNNGWSTHFHTVNTAKMNRRNHIGEMIFDSDYTGQFFFASLHSYFLYHSDIGTYVHVYDELTKTWATEQQAESLIHVMYRSWQRNFVEEVDDLLTLCQLTWPDVPKSMSVMQKVTKIGNSGYNEAIVKAHRMVDQQAEAKLMDPLAHLVPLKDGTCFNVFTGEVRPIVKTDRFTSTIEGKLIDPHHPDCDIIRQWVLEMCDCRPLFRTHMLRHFGYDFTRLVSERRMVVMRGPGRDGKGTTSKMMGNTLGERYLALKDGFFGEENNRRSDAEAPSAHALELRYKTLAMIEDLKDGFLDGGKIKSYVAADVVTGRQLHCKYPVHFQQQSKIMIATNHDVQFRNFDNALGDRILIWPMDVRWVQEMDANDNHTQMKADENKRDSMLTKIDAFTTVCLFAIRDFYLENPPGSEGFAKGIPLPPCVIQANEIYRKNNDLVYAFVEACVDLSYKTDLGRGVPVNKMFQAFVHWLSKTGKPKSHMDEHAFGRTMAEKSIHFDEHTRMFPYYHKKKSEAVLESYYTPNARDELMRNHLAPSSSSSSSSSSSVPVQISADANVGFTIHM